MRDRAVHMREETIDLPALEQVLSERRSEALVTAFLRVKMFAPGRAHVMSPSEATPTIRLLCRRCADISPRRCVPKVP